MSMSESPPTTVVDIKNLTVLYGKQRALHDVTASFPPGAVGLLGPNGAGKSTLLKTLLGFLKPAAGTMNVLGLDVATSPAEIRARLGYMPEIDAHIPGMNAVSFVAYCGELAGLPPVDAMQRAHEVLYYVGLGEARYRNVETYSTGMKQRIKLAQALVHDPDLLFLDEPTNGMDPKGREEMLELIRDLAHNKGMNLILSSHLLPDVEFTCDYVVVLHQGSVATQGPIEELKAPRGSVFEFRIKGDRVAFSRVLAGAGMTCHAGEEDIMRVFVPDQRGAHALFALAARARRAGAPPAAQRADPRRRVRPGGGRGVGRAHPRPELPALRRRAQAPGSRVDGHRHDRRQDHARQAQVPGPAACRLAALHRPRRADLRRGELPAGVDDRADGRDVPPVRRAAGRLRLLRHHLHRRRPDRERPAGQCPADLPVEAPGPVRVHRRQVRRPRVLPAAGHLAAGDDAAGRPGGVRRQPDVPEGEPVPAAGDPRVDGHRDHRAVPGDARAVVALEERAVRRHHVRGHDVLHRRVCTASSTG